MKSQHLPMALLLLLALSLLSACSGAPAQPASVVAQFDVLPAPERTAIAASVQAIEKPSAEEIAAFRAMAQDYVAAHPEVGLAPAPAAAASRSSTANLGLPQIQYWFAARPSADQRKEGIWFVMHYYVQGADRVEIYGNKLGNAQQGVWPVWEGPEVNPHWTITAFNSTGFVERYVKVESDKDLGTALAPVNVKNRSVTLTFRDPQYVDGDYVTLILNGAVIWQGLADGYPISLPVTLNGGSNVLQVQSINEGDTPLTVLELSISNVSAGAATQTTRALRAGNIEVLNLTAP